jgi:hypothetical protein
MNTNEIESALRSNPKTASLFRGVFACDTVPADIQPLPAGLIINTDPSSKAGTHWVAVFQEHPRTIEFFDSFGKEVEYYGKCLAKALSGKRVISQQQQLQSDFSELCGQYCMFFLYKRSLGYSFDNVLASFSSNTISNDVVVDSFVSAQFDCTPRHMGLIIME